MRLLFTINNEYLIQHTLMQTEKFGLSGTNGKNDLVEFQNRAWDISEAQYRILNGKYSLATSSLAEFHRQARRLPQYIAKLKKTREFGVVKRQVVAYRRELEKEWQRNLPTSATIMRELTSLSLNDSFQVLLTHPSQRNGHYFGNRMIAWGRTAEWKNYATVYLWHEILHEYFGYSETEHAIIQLLTDNELRVRLNGGKYPPFEGHSHLEGEMKRLLPSWKRFLRRKSKDISEYISESKKRE